MKKFLIIIFLFFISSSVFASDIKTIQYKNICKKDKLAITETEQWTQKVGRKNTNFYFVNDTALTSQDETKTIYTGCSYLFVNNGKLIGYSDTDLKFYEFVPSQETISKNELSVKDISELFKDFRIILISDFSKATNVYKFNKKRCQEKIMIVNDSDTIFNNYGFTTHNSRFKKYNINNAISITKKGMIQFSEFGENTKGSPWFILLVR